MGEKVPNSSINQQLVDRWVAKMQNPKEGKTMSQTTIGIYLRAFRVVVRRAASMGVLLNDKMDLFKGVKDVNRKGERKEWFLNVEKMTRLYEFFEKGETKDQEGNELYDPQYKKRLFHSLGLFLFSYLANGANMADIVKLRYDDFYYNHEQKAMRFIRQKTMRETDGMEVIFPILPQMQVILDRIARKPQRGALVFDIIKDGMTEKRIKEIVSCENANINARMENIAKLLGMEERPTPTWCRHSYATNLRDAGVSTEYISTMMGHTMTSFVSSQWDTTKIKDFGKKRFFYIVAGGDKKASGGMSDLTKVLKDNGARIDSASWSAKLPQEDQERLAEELISKGGNINFIKWEAGSVLPESGKGMEHMASFDFAYKLAAVRDWLFKQTK